MPTAPQEAEGPAWRTAPQAMQTTLCTIVTESGTHLYKLLKNPKSHSKSLCVCTLARFGVPFCGWRVSGVWGIAQQPYFQHKRY
eukprot:897040-Amphidinium_carterae.1